MGCTVLSGYIHFSYLVNFSSWAEKFSNGLCTHFLQLYGLKRSRNRSRLIHLRCEWTLSQSNKLTSSFQFRPCGFLIDWFKFVPRLCRQTIINERQHDTIKCNPLICTIYFADIHYFFNRTLLCSWWRDITCCGLTSNFISRFRIC